MMQATLSPHRIALILAHATTLLAHSSAHAQTGACDQLKAKLSARIDPSIRNFSLEAVAADTPVPTGAKVIGTCEGGARKVLMRRGMAVQASVDSRGTPVPDSPPLARVAATPAVPPAPMPAPVSSPEPKKIQAAESVGVPPPPAVALVEAARPMLEPMKVEPPAPQPSPALVFVTANTTTQALNPGFFARYWMWILAPVLLVLAGMLWAWISHRMAYDAAGLPRGPRLN
jgi:hypothetical protein